MTVAVNSHAKSQGTRGLRRRDIPIKNQGIVRGQIAVAHLHTLIDLMASKNGGVAYEISNPNRRSTEQNRLQRLWMKEAAEQMQDETAEQKRGYCKLHFGVPIVCDGIPEFHEKYYRLIRPLPYEAKLELMMVPLDFPVTRIMTPRMKSEYLNQVYTHFTGLGCELTQPSEGFWESLLEAAA